MSAGYQTSRRCGRLDDRTDRATIRQCAKPQSTSVSLARLPAANHSRRFQLLSYRQVAAATRFPLLLLSVGVIVDTKTIACNYHLGFMQSRGRDRTWLKRKRRNRQKTNCCE